MSVTFSITRAPRHLQLSTCMCAQEAPLDLLLGEPLEVAADLAAFADPACGLCRGEGTYSYRDVAPEHAINYCNSNAAALLRTIGLEARELWGAVPASDVPALARRIHGAMLDSRRRAKQLRAPLVRPPVPSSFEVEVEVEVRVVKKPGRAGFVRGGLDDAGMLRRLGEMLQLCHEAQNLKSGIEWG